MNETFVKELAERLARPVVENEGTDEAPRRVVIIPKGWERLEADVPRPLCIEVSKLSSFRDYLERNTDGLEKSRLLLHVKSPTEVVLRGALEGEEKRFRRTDYMWARPVLPEFKFGVFHDAESFVIGLQTAFLASPARDQLLTLVSGISENQVRETRDDGFAQEVNVSKGITLVGKVALPNPVALRPYRTFPEVDQPESQFVLRAKAAANGAEKPTLALFECDGGAWRMDAMGRIGTWLRDTLADVPVIS